MNRYPTVKLAKNRQLPYTVLAIVFLAIMLFPVYWMINTSLQPGPSAVNATFIPLHPSFAAYGQAISDQLGNLETSLLIASGTVILTLVSPRRLLTGSRSLSCHSSAPSCWPF